MVLARAWASGGSDGKMKSAAYFWFGAEAAKARSRTFWDTNARSPVSFGSPEIEIARSLGKLKHLAP
jgi:hypothetical protein